MMKLFGKNISVVHIFICGLLVAIALLLTQYYGSLTKTQVAPVVLPDDLKFVGCVKTEKDKLEICKNKAWGFFQKDVANAKTQQEALAAYAWYLGKEKQCQAEYDKYILACNAYLSVSSTLASVSPAPSIVPIPPV